MAGKKGDGKAAAPGKGVAGSQHSPTTSDSSGSTLGGHATPAVAQQSPMSAVRSSAHDSFNSGLEELLRSGFFAKNNPLYTERDIPNGGQQSSSPIEAPTRPARYVPTQPAYQHRARNAGAWGKNQANNYRSSRTWHSPEAQRYHDYQLVRNAMRRLFKKSEVAKWTYDDYIKHLEATLASKKAHLDKVLATKEHERLDKLHNGRFYTSPQTLKAIEKGCLPNGNDTLQGNTSRALAMKTIWCPDWKNGKEEIANWPTLQEMKWEGDDRAKTGVGRFPPLPRENGPPSIPWNQLPVVEQYELDEVARIPTLEDVLLPVDEIPDEDAPLFVDQHVWDAIDEYLES
ncbi:unnamed protein product [Periconia digitata]|uniref:Uncharacterized protein n=1 Tax=Periconia digitata TaxID=1303443 RepID=A0A9W4XGU3_9PLEO|nr:unnamed protein product [Periconia digitata]